MLLSILVLCVLPLVLFVSFSFSDALIVLSLIHISKSAQIKPSSRLSIKLGYLSKYISANSSYLFRSASFCRRTLPPLPSSPSFTKYWMPVPECVFNVNPCKVSDVYKRQPHSADESRFIFYGSLKFCIVMCIGNVGITMCFRTFKHFSLDRF